MAGVLDYLLGEQPNQEMGLLARLMTAAGTAGLPASLPSGGIGRAGAPNALPEPPEVGSGRLPIDAPPSTNDPFASEPTLYQGGVPLPRPRPPEAGANPGEGPAPLSLAPGDYQDKAALPPTSTPTIGQGAPAAAPVAQAESPNALSGLGGFAKSLFNKLTDPNTAATRLALASGFAGAPSFGTGMQRAFGAAVPALAADRAFAQKQSGIADTYRALVAKGVPPVEALAAVNNPDVMKATAAKYFETKPRTVHDITDQLGNKTPVTFDPNTGKFYDMANKEINAPGGMNTASAQAADPANIDPTTGRNEKFLKTLDPETQNSVKAFVEGRANVAGRNMQKMLPLITSYDPNFQASDYPVRLALRKGYQGGGKQFQEMQAIDTVAGHLGNLAKSADNLKNTSFPWWNMVGNMALQNTGDPRVDKFNTDKQAVSNELSKAYRGGQVTEGDVREWQTNINSSKSPEQLRQVIGEFNDLLDSKRKALESGYRAGMGPAPLPAEFSSTSQRARETFDRVARWSQGEKDASPMAPHAAPAAPAPQTQPGVPEPIAQARAAIAAGAPRDAVIQRLRQSGIDPVGL